MIDYKEQIAQLLLGKLEGFSIEELKKMVEIPADNKMGDYAFPCFRLAKVMRKAPPLIAKGLAEELSQESMFDKVEQVNGYVNMFISRNAFIESTLDEVLKKGDDYGRSEQGQGKTLM